MKLRIKGNSLRLRLTQSEMHLFDERGEAQDRIEFPNGAELIYRLSVDLDSPDISVDYKENLIDVRIPKKLAERWCGTDLVTLRGTLPVASGELGVVLEKDFTCLTPREGEDESDNFPHPGAAQGRKC